MGDRRNAQANVPYPCSPGTAVAQFTVNNFLENQQEPHVAKMLRATRQTGAGKFAWCVKRKLSINQSIKTPPTGRLKKKKDA
jgi:hypothetical protein